ncbi:pentatricopeptide repeat-containing protein At3g49170, chloroplastic-like [Eucalyptus grandis]|uniref:pentatricopeptide repeat-containing protein At3g49170, chloroplastic-like n=1 Tax=Eucalyptus grandis TaxID=71139 RepID=UPI00192E7E61|nr:pentatricopeptide repeat-containing protein At3g49170, chloroplastic-like [Eucalyptus grandis]
MSANSAEHSPISTSCPVMGPIPTSSPSLSPPQVLHSLPRARAREARPSVARSVSAEPDSVVLNSLISLYSKCNDWAEAERTLRDMAIDLFSQGSADLVSGRKLFEKMPERNVVVWTLMMTRCTQLGCPNKAVDLFLDMLGSGLCQIDLHLQLLVDMYVKCVASGSIHDLRKVFNRMQDCNVMSWTPIITGHVQTEENEHHFTLASALKACGSICDNRHGDSNIRYVFAKSLESDEAFELLHEIEERGIGQMLLHFPAFQVELPVLALLMRGSKSGLNSNQCILNGLISMYSRCGNTEAAF